jgi:hypothetical protein
MSQDPLVNRKFTEKETGAILQRATELQAEEEGAPAGDGTSLAQLQQAAAELGIACGRVGLRLLYARGDDRFDREPRPDFNPSRLVFAGGYGSRRWAVCRRVRGGAHRLSGHRHGAAPNHQRSARRSGTTTRTGRNSNRPVIASYQTPTDSEVQPVSQVVGIIDQR